MKQFLRTLLFNLRLAQKPIDQRALLIELNQLKATSLFAFVGKDDNEKQQYRDIDCHVDFEQYQKLIKEGGTDTQFGLDHPIAAQFFRELATIDAMATPIDKTVGSVFKRLSYELVPHMHKDLSKLGDRTKSKLPSIVILPNSSTNLSFIRDALNGLANLNFVLADALIEEFWTDKPHFYPLLLQELQKELLQWDHTQIRFLPDKNTLVEKIARQIQSETALVNLLKREPCRSIITGNGGLALQLQAFDLPKALAPHLAFFEHGHTYGDPYHSFLVRADSFFVTGNRDKCCWMDSGVSEAKFLMLGNPKLEGMPSFNYLHEQKQRIRQSLCIPDDAKVITYGTDFQVDLYKRPESDQIQDTLIRLIKYVQENSKHNLVLNLKFHPSSGDPGFQRSRYDYPLKKFAELAEVDVRIASDLHQALAISDCYLCHESTTLGEAVAVGTTTFSIDFIRQAGRPVLDYTAYQEPSAHRLYSVGNDIAEMGDALINLLDLQDLHVYQANQKIFDNLYASGRSKALMQLANYYDRLFSDKQ
ncbi:MAG: hypothetical protein KA794_12575 [Candidatus Obscuribacter sp.]|jgi:hypothetical protein|nr:hypothetical protein [Candidatus Obscuribacter sp.]